MLRRRWTTFALHILAWGIFFSLPLLLSPRRDTAALAARGPMLLPPSPGVELMFVVVMVLFNLLLAGFFYVNYFRLLPRLWQQRGIGPYLAGIAIAALVVVLLPLGVRQWLISSPVPGPPFFHFGLLVMGANFGLAWAVSSGLWLAEAYQRAERRRMESENARLATELTQLKAQLHPHFLFNTLNGIYALTLSKSEAAPEAILRLSNLLRYVLSEAIADFVPVGRELEHLRYFVELHQMRLSTATSVHFSIDGEPHAGQLIAPLLLLPFVENAFKFGASTRVASTIEIRTDLYPGRLEFICRNRILREAAAETEPSGIGLMNTHRRLALLYPGHHSLDIARAGGIFQVTLILQTEP